MAEILSDKAGLWVDCWLMDEKFAKIFLKFKNIFSLLRGLAGDGKYLNSKTGLINFLSYKFFSSNKFPQICPVYQCSYKYHAIKPNEQNK